MRPELSEDDVLAAIVQYAQLRGILVHHSRPARTANGWATPIQGDKGLPDLILAGRNGVLFRELKTARGRLSEDQDTWISRLVRARQNVAVWRTTDWPTRIRKELEEIR